MFIERGPEPLLSDILRRHKGLILFAFAWLLLFAYIIKAGGPITSTFDTFIFPMALLILLARQSEPALKFTALLIHAFMAANAILALAELIGGFRLTPIVAQGIIVVDWRSSAFFGQPLTNALATGCYALTLMLGGDRDLPSILRFPALGLQLMAMVAFGGRVASALLALAMLVVIVRLAVQILAGRRFTTTAAAAVCFVAPIMLVGLVLLVADGFLDKFLSRFTEDGGSANSRLVMFDVLGQFTFEDLLVGPDQSVLSTLQRVYGIAFGIESFWFAFIAFYGILICIPFFIGFFAFLFDVRRSANQQSIYVLVYFLAVCSTSLSLAGKSTMMGVLVATVVVLLRQTSAKDKLSKKTIERGVDRGFSGAASTRQRKAPA